MGKILGLDLGTASIGWSLIEVDGKGQPKEITKVESLDAIGDRYHVEAIQPTIFSEPSAVCHHANRISFHSSFADAARSEVLSVINQLPVERLRNTVELILRVYNVTREALKQRVPNRSVKITRNK